MLCWRLMGIEPTSNPYKLRKCRIYVKKCFIQIFYDMLVYMLFVSVGVIRSFSCYILFLVNMLY